MPYTGPKPLDVDAIMNCNPHEWENIGGHPGKMQHLHKAPPLIHYECVKCGYRFYGQGTWFPENGRGPNTV
eukprot:g18930.t1